MRFPLCVPLYVVLTLSTLHLLAQSPDGNINGLVSDPSSAAVVGAEVVAVNDVTGVQYTTKTNNEGIYVLPNLPPGPYRLQVSKVGFKTLIKPDIVLSVQDALSINFTLPIGAAYEVLTVEGGAPLVNTESAAVSTVIDHAYIENMPLNGRSFQDLILLTPGVVMQTPQFAQSASAISPGVGRTGEFSINGQRTESNNYTVDGVSANVGAATGAGMTLGAGPSGSVAASTALGTTQALVSVDDLQEFRVQSSTYSAEHGRNPGGQFAFETKSGTNQWHGTAYDYLRNGFFDAHDWFDDYFGLTEPALRQNDFGGTLGGPMRIPGLYNGRDRSFFFVSYEGLRLAAPQAGTVNFVPDAFLRANAAAPLQQALNAFPLPNGLDLGEGIAEYVGSWSNPGSLDSTSIRFDHVLSEKLRLFFRFSNTASASTVRGTPAISNSPTASKTSAYTLQTYTVGATSMFSSGASNEFRLNYTSNQVTDRTVIDAFGGGTPLDLAQLLQLGAGSDVSVALCYSECITLEQLQQAGAQRQWNLVDTASLSLGRHHFKLGMDYRRLSPFATVATPAVGYIYLSEPSVLTNSANYELVSVQASAYPLYANFSAFGQDEWSVSQRLNLSFGLRWEVNPAPGVTQGLKPYTLQGFGPNTWTLAPEGAALWHTTWYNFAPRLGGAYILRSASGSEIVVRGGVGVFFDTGQQLGSLGFNGPGYSALSVSTSESFPVVSVVPTVENPPVAPYNVTPYGFAPHLQLPYTLQWNASIEQSLGKSQAVTVSYVGAHAARLLQENLFEPPNNPNSPFGFYIVENGLTSDYDALQAQFRRRLSQGLTVLASYTWSHCLDYGSSNLINGYQRGNCDFDVRQSLNAASSYDLPDIGQNAFVRGALHRWGVDNRFTLRSAFPITLRGVPGPPQPNGQIYDLGLNLVSGEPIYLYGANCEAILQGLGDLASGQGCPGGRAINPNAFTSVNVGLGDAPRNFARLFGAWQWDMAVRRDLPIRERLKLQFRVEAFNLFNHPNFGTVNEQFGQATFGQAAGTLASSLGVLSPLYQMGGPRSMQFALKLVF